MKENLNAWDRFLSFFSAKAGYRRAAYRSAAQMLRKYEGAAKGRRGKNWRANSTSANSEIQSSMSLLRNRARQLVRDNSYASKGLQVITSNVVGKGIFTQVKVDADRANGESRAREREKQLTLLWKAWAGTPCIDYDHRHDLTGLQRLAMREVVESGEVLIRRRRAPARRETCEGVQVDIPPVTLQVLESDFLDLNQIAITTKPMDDNEIIQGIEFDSQGKRVAYHIFKEHPGNVALGSGRTLASQFETIRVPADEILHLYRMDRAGQHRGVTWFAPIMFRLKDFDEYEDAQLVRQKIAAMFAVFVRDLEGINESPAPAEGELGEKVEPGIIEILPPGKDITLANPPGVEGYREYTSTQLHAIAAGLGITYEALTGDLSEVNFSSGRMGRIEMNRNVREWQHILVSQMLNPIFDWWMNGVDLLGQGTNQVRPVFTPPRIEMIDPQKETAAMKDAVRSGFMSLSEAVRTQGRDPEMHFEEMESDKKILEEKSLVLDTDPSQDANRIQRNESAPAQSPPNGDSQD